MMTERDPELQQLFSDLRRPVADAGFTAQVVERMQHEQDVRARRRYVGIAIAMIAAAFVAPLLFNGLSLLSTQLISQLGLEPGDSESLSQWLPALLLGVAAFGFANVRRLILR